MTRKEYLEFKSHYKYDPYKNMCFNSCGNCPNAETRRSYAVEYNIDGRDYICTNLMRVLEKIFRSSFIDNHNSNLQEIAKGN